MLLKHKSPLLLLLSLLLLFLHTADIQAQDALVLSKRKNKRLEKIFVVGDKIVFRLKESKTFETGIINGIEKDGFHTNGRLVHVEQLAIVSKTGRGLKFALGVASAAAGSVILFAGIFQGFWVYAVGSAFLGTGLVQTGLYGVRMLLHNRYNVEKKWQFDVRQIESE